MVSCELLDLAKQVRSGLVTRERKGKPGVREKRTVSGMHGVGKARQGGEDDSWRRGTQSRASTERGMEAGRRRGRPGRRLKESD